MLSSPTVLESDGPEPDRPPGPAQGTVRLRIDVGYDGTGYAGWARQPGQRTVQGTLERAFGLVLRLPVAPTLVVAGRTDAGVHARGQVAHLDAPHDAWRAVSELLVRRLAGVLPADVRVRTIVPAPPGFDARFSALARRYAYRVSDQPWGVDPLQRLHAFGRPRPLDRPLDLAAMNAAATGLLGEHDFAAYCRRRAGATTIRRLLSLSWSRDAGPDSGLLVADVQADAFCHSMVRALVGSLLVVGEGRRTPDWPAQVLARRVRDPAVPVVPAHGLTLEEVRYPPDAELAARARETRRRRTQPPGTADGAPPGR